MVKIFIDPGHGGADPGGAGSGLLEKNITLKIGTRVRSILLNAGSYCEDEPQRQSDGDTEAAY